MHRAVATLLFAGVWIPRFIPVTTMATFPAVILALERSKASSHVGWMLGSSLVKNDIKVMQCLLEQIRYECEGS